MFRPVLLSAALLPIACSTSPEPRYAARDRELTAQAATAAVEESAGQSRENQPGTTGLPGDDRPAAADPLASGAATPGFVGSQVQPSGLQTDRDALYANNRVTLQVEVGGQTRPVVIELDPQGAPQSVANFKRNVRSGAYDNLQFHRAIPGYLVQTGDPLTRDPARRGSWGTGGPNYTVPFEKNGSFTTGTVGIARLNDEVNPSRANNGSQFFIALGTQNQLNGDYTAVGRVVEGMDAINAIAATATDENDIPTQPVLLKDAELTAGGPAGDERITFDTATVPKIRATGAGGGSGAPRINPRLVGPPEPGSFRSILNRIW